MRAKLVNYGVSLSLRPNPGRATARALEEIPDVQVVGLRLVPRPRGLERRRVFQALLRLRARRRAGVDVYTVLPCVREAFPPRDLLEELLGREAS
jgi:hypothetical protein